MRHHTKLLALAAAIVATAASVGSAARPAAVDGEAAARGSVTFRVYCGSCHGRGGKGDGKLAGELRTRPADLTQLASRNGGTLDVAAVRARVDGREEVAAHGDREMPVWGASFQPDPAAGADGEAAVRAKLDDLVAFLQTLQAPATAPGSPPGSASPRSPASPTPAPTPHR